MNKEELKNPDFSELIVSKNGFEITAPTIINTFLESYNFAGKKIVLLASSGGSGFGNTVAECHIYCAQSLAVYIAQFYQNIFVIFGVLCNLLQCMCKKLQKAL